MRFSGLFPDSLVACVFIEESRPLEEGTLAEKWLMLVVKFVIVVRMYAITAKNQLFIFT